jgi:hypothetical protein
MPDQICPYCKNVMRPLDNHAMQISRDSMSEKPMVQVTCMLSRYYITEVKEA